MMASRQSLGVYASESCEVPKKNFINADFPSLQIGG